ncbi:MAG: glycine betaine ABC transporter substrate-binding protein [Thermodesulfobacteriota bacterium]
MLKRILVLTAVFLISISSAVFAKEKVVLSYVEWAETVVSTHVVKTILEDMDYDVEIISASSAAMWSGDVDGFTGAWLPVTHAHYLKKHGKDIEILGKILDGAKVGFAVPEYVDIDSIEDLRKNPELFDEEIIGIDPGSGIMRLAEKVIKEYSLENYELLPSSGPIMAAMLKDKLDDKKPVVVTAWTPHWVFSKWDLKYLKDPKNIFGDNEYVAAIGRKGLKKEKPEVYKVLKNFNWSIEDCTEVMLEAENTSAGEAARKWVDENQDKIKKWTE